MSIRLSIISTRTGDDGTTGLGDGTRLPKDAPRIAALGDVDELNSMIGLWRTEALPPDVAALLGRIQNELFDLGGELCIPGHAAVTEAHVARLDEALAHYNAGLGRLQEFILPGGCRAAALAHMARTLARRAERAVVALDREEAVNPPVRQYLNRLSDLCFVLARTLNRAAGVPDVCWTGPQHASGA
ncbi:cob(I)yrinic acid a,c-diamide adenosyltransferase [Castellaniella sp. S9]|uniref:cob(I)yrinic acid a,c-diamide adenosyltransferase n=1 Tax=Castellaniella sp. S9 TaxID=2993652 RepID=UPI0022B4D3AC|nr:cob(I)yrinic acid a,c-diamide adenosyltransferase [Castellaniella sp. S9]